MMKLILMDQRCMQIEIKCVFVSSVVSASAALKMNVSEEELQNKPITFEIFSSLGIISK